MTSTIASYQLIASNLTRSLQQTAKKPDVSRDTEYYLAHIGTVTSIESFITDYRLFSYAMKAHGLSDMVYAKAFMRKVLDEGVATAGTFANNLSDSRYREFAAAFDFAGQGASATKAASATTDTVGKYLNQSLEEDAGSKDEGVRLALYFLRKAPDIKNSYQVLADAALLKVAQTALGISAVTSMAGIDKQAAMLTKAIDFSDFRDPDKLHQFLQRFSAMWDAETNQATVSTPSILLNQPIEMGISADTLAGLQKLKLGR
jgi:Protein of unknown function (DUF1217)